MARQVRVAERSRASFELSALSIFLLTDAMIFMRKVLLAQVICAAAAINTVAAQTPGAAVSTSPASALAEASGIDAWLLQMHEASRKRAYVGTFVVSSGGAMTSTKIWHVCDGQTQVERLDALSGSPRTVFRHNETILTFLPDQKVVRSEKREALGLFPQLLKSNNPKIADFYRLKTEGTERVAGLEANVVQLIAKDALRYGYRVWTEQKQGLVVKLQTVDEQGVVLEQAAFSDLQLDAPVKMDKLLQMMGRVDGYRVEQSAVTKTTAAAEGWMMRSVVAGFRPIGCYKRPASVQNSDEPIQWIFSDGLASVSLFVEPIDRQRHDKETHMALGATHTLSRPVGVHWLTVVGEVPAATLKLFASGLERKK
jgi:sigma-E factor negative regulatory protein RseB